MKGNSVTKKVIEGRLEKKERVRGDVFWHELWVDGDELVYMAEDFLGSKVRITITKKTPERK